eukprot:IDg7935t1
MRVTSIFMSLTLLGVERGGQRTHAFSYLAMALRSAMDDLPLTTWTSSDVVNEARADINLLSACLRFFGEVFSNKMAVLHFLAMNFVFGKVFWSQPL